MRLRFVLPSLTCLLISSAALADYGTPPPPPQPSSSGSATPSQEGDRMSTRKDAERYFADAYNDVVKAGKDAAKGKQDAAAKKYTRALERCRNAVQLDSTYHEAWNLIGFTSRKLGDYPSSFAAYRVALRLKPDFALAHEYYGEGLLETGDLAGAKEQLAALKASGTPDLIAELEGAVARYEAAHPQAPAASAKAPADSAAAPGAGN